MSELRGDCISRAVAIDAIKHVIIEFPVLLTSQHEQIVIKTVKLTRNTIENVLIKLPPVEPEKCNDCIGKKEVAKDQFDLVQSNDIMAFIPRCKGCKYFEYDSVAKVDGIPLIVAHEICKRWGNGCKTREDGYCFLYEPHESEE